MSLLPWAGVPALLLVALLAGCASAEFTPSGVGEHPPRHEGEVAVLDRLPPVGSYRMLGVVTVRGVGITSDERMFEEFREMAARRGADAVVPQGKIRTGSTGDGGETRTLAGYAIRRR